ncbi:cytochrome P450 1A1-like isoform X2 [Ostrea edulis]|uniref:cytochrome P450 1A1-like isoform X2 n=1 Tax=Ostrea edulis TaxID=37623 RepID=UPI0024AF0241|nr:cytochrome P450 1A1-like isoform X2 [Ostrea edulis]
MAVWYVVLIFVISFLTILISKKCRLKKQFPGPKGTPVIGVIWGLDLASLHLKLYEWSKLYGDIFQFSCLGKKFLVINSSVVLRELFLKEPNSTITADRPETFFGNYIYKNSDVVFASSDHKWARRRKLMYKLLHAYGEGLVDVERQIRYNLHSLTEEIRLLQNGTIDPSNIVEEFILNTIEVLCGEPVGVYRALKDATTERDAAGERWFTADNHWTMIHDIITGGHLSTKGTLLSLIHILAKRPDIQKSIQSEIDNVIGVDREPVLADRQHCPLVTAVILETLRYISHLPIVTHNTSKPTHIDGIPVERNTTIIVNLWTMHHNAKEWDIPFVFKPERFLHADGSLLPSTNTIRKRMLAFGVGKRGCVGDVFAMSRIFLFVSTLLQHFTILEPKDEPLPDLLPRDLDPGVVLQTKPFKVRFVKRNNRY